MYVVLMVCGWGLTASVIARVWIAGRPGRRLPVALAVGLVAGLLWPVTLWAALGAWLYRRAPRSAPAGGTADALGVQADEAAALAREAELERMPASAACWRAEAARLLARQAAEDHPAATGGILLGCTAGALATVGLVALVTPAVSGPPAPVTSAGATVSAPTVATPATAPLAPPPRGRSTTYTYRVEGNYRAGSVGYPGSTGDAPRLNGSRTLTGTDLPWTRTVRAEPNGGDTLSAQILSGTGDSVITCSITDDQGTVVATQTGRGAHASCSVSAPR
ncbi:MAG TPA: hypothetical protein VGH99_21025 [Pseudonocardia sp.]|jgi:hypothetical protein